MVPSPPHRFPVLRLLPRPTPARRVVRLACCAGLILPLVVLSLFIGSRAIAPADVVDALLHADPANDEHLVIWHGRLPRAAIAVCGGGCLGIAGALMQSLTRNALAEPGTLGVNAGAAAGVAAGLLVVGGSGIAVYVWFAFAGAAVAALLVHRLGRARDAGQNSVRLVLAGAGISMTLGSFTTLAILAGPSDVFSGMRSWATGSLEGRDWSHLPVPAVALLLGAVACLYLAGPLNSTTLGADLGQALGVNIALTWSLANLGIIVLAGAATAAMGPVGFVGLAAPHLARTAAGPDHRWLLPFSAVFATILVLLADIAGRVVVAPSEVGAGIMSAVIGAPFFIGLIRRGKVAGL